MYIKTIELENFRNLEKSSLSFVKNLNIITGDNAQGKTNLLESIWLLTGCRSFRGSQEKNLIAFGKDRFEINMSFFADGRNQKIRYIILRSADKEKKKKITLNGVDIASPKQLFESFKCICFVPEDIEIVKGAPSERRKFCDLCVSQITPSQMDNLKKLNSVCMQKKSVIKQINYENMPNFEAFSGILDVYDKQMARFGSMLSVLRCKYVKLLNETASKIYSQITDGNEMLEITYISGIFDKNTDILNTDVKTLEEEYLKKLKKSREADIASNHAHLGAERDDLKLQVNKKSLRDFGSQGQKKSAALALRLSQAQIFVKMLDEKPVILLDDVMGELDEKRQNFVYKIIKDMQVFITTCHTETVKNAGMGRIFDVEKGKIVAGDSRKATKISPPQAGGKILK